MSGLPEFGAGLGTKLALGLAGLAFKGVTAVIGGTVDLGGNKNIDFDLELDGVSNETDVILPPVGKQMINSHGFVFGSQNNASIARPEFEDGHIMVVGGSGSGKSSCIAIPTLLSWNERVFAIDVKGELYTATKHKRPNIKWFCPLDSNTFGYDPFYTLRTARNQTQEAQSIAHALIPLPPNTKEPFWIQSAQNLLTGAILHFFNLGCTFIETVSNLLLTPVDRVVEEISSSPSKQASYFVSGFIDMKLETLSSILNEVKNNIHMFVTDDDVRNSFSKSSNITPEDLEKGYDVYIIVPEHLLEQWKNLLALIVSQFIKHFEQRANMASKPILFLLDEFPRLGEIEPIVSGLATLRSKKITISIILQSLAQLDDIYGRDKRKVIADNCLYKAVLNANDVETQEYFSKAVGTYDKSKVSTTQQYKRFTNFKAGSSISTSTEEKAIIKPHEFATLNKIVLLTPYGAFKVDKKPYFNSY